MTDREREPGSIRAKTIIEGECPFCTGTFTVCEEISTKTPFVAHTQPMCRKFDEMDPTSFLSAVNDELLKSQGGGRA